MIDNVESDYLTTEELAKYLGLSKSTLNNWRAQSTEKKVIGIPFKKFGRAIRYKKSDILEFERSNGFGTDN